KDCTALQRAIKDGTIDAIASDHAPHREEDKRAGAPGLIGLETTLGVVLTRLVHPGIISLKEAVRLMSNNPARVFGLEGGSLTVGSPADITVIDMEREWIVEGRRFQSLARNCPFEGWRLKGQAVLTMVGGRVVMRDGVAAGFSLRSF
ncbi:MAG: amidohydrolase family protein, partial [Candidatus Brocadiaceae bacterium]|nr:amidohydrolase family protein [Candidatus Brocadiaceae bacterium]